MILTWKRQKAAAQYVVLVALGYTNESVQWNLRSVKENLNERKRTRSIPSQVTNLSAVCTRLVRLVQCPIRLNPQKHTICHVLLGGAGS